MNNKAAHEAWWLAVGQDIGFAVFDKVLRMEAAYQTFKWQTNSPIARRAWARYASRKAYSVWHKAEVTDEVWWETWINRKEAIGERVWIPFPRA